jgi:hypothetical protein
MSERFLRNRRDGTIYHWNEILAENILCEEVTEEEAFPEKFIPKKQKGRKSGLALETEDIPVEPEVVNEELNIEMSRGLPT